MIVIRTPALRSTERSDDRTSHIRAVGAGGDDGGALASPDQFTTVRRRRC
jgi:hypothetical protein